MSNRNGDHDWQFGKRTWKIRGSFATNGSSAIAASSVRGFGFGYAPVNGVMALGPTTPGVSGTPGITRTGTGILLVTLEDPYLELVSCIVTLSRPSTYDGSYAGYGEEANFGVTTPTCPSVTIITYAAGGTPTDIAANAASRVSFAFVLRDSTERYGRP